MANIFSKAKRTIMMYSWPELCRPKTARLIITTNCNFRCQMCTFWKDKPIEASLDTIKYWIKELAEFGIETMDLGGGEPTLKKELPEIIKEVKSCGVKCGLTTNGWMISQMPFPDLDYIDISIDGAKPETHDKIRGVKGAWERAIKAAQIAKEHCPTRLNYVLQAVNYTELVDFCHLAKKLGVSAGLIPVSLKLVAQPRISDTLSEYNIPILRKILAAAFETGIIEHNQELFNIFLKKLENGPSPQKCLAPYRGVLIFTDSNVYPCGSYDIPVGNLSEGRKFKDIYDNYKNIRKETWAGCHKFCDKCVYSDLSNRATMRSSVIPYFQKLTKIKPSINT